MRLLIACGLCALGASIAGASQTGTLLAMGPAWSVDVSHPSSAARVADDSAAIHLPGNAHWTTYVIRSEGETYILREKALGERAALTANQSIAFSVSGDHRRVSFKDQDGTKHRAFLVSK